MPYRPNFYSQLKTKTLFAIYFTVKLPRPESGRNTGKFWSFKKGHSILISTIISQTS